METRPLYVPDYGKFKHYFDNKHVKKTSNLLYGKAKRMVIPVWNHTALQSKQPTTEVTLRMTSESRSEVERAEAKDKRAKAIKRKAGGRCITSKKIRRTENTASALPSKTAKALKCTPIQEDDIFS